jgi:hypothetical protein
MKDILTFSAAMIGAYAAFMGILILFARLFFPFYTKEQLERMKEIETPRKTDKRKVLRRKAIEKLNVRSKISLAPTAYSKLARA